MEKTVNLKMPGVTELGREELKEVDGGIIPLIFLAAGAICAMSFWMGTKDGEREKERNT